MCNNPMILCFKLRHHRGSEDIIRGSVTGVDMEMSDVLTQGERGLDVRQAPMRKNWRDVLCPPTRTDFV